MPYSSKTSHFCVTICFTSSRLWYTSFWETATYQCPYIKIIKHLGRAYKQLGKDSGREGFLKLQVDQNKSSKINGRPFCVSHQQGTMSTRSLVVLPIPPLPLPPPLLLTCNQNLLLFWSTVELFYIVAYPLYIHINLQLVLCGLSEIITSITYIL